MLRRRRASTLSDLRAEQTSGGLASCEMECVWVCKGLRSRGMQGF